MKILLVLVFVILYQSYEVNCTNFLTPVSNKITNFFSKDIPSWYKKVRLSIRNFMFPECVGSKLSEFKRKVKKFSDFVEEEAAKNGTESPEFVSLRSEPTALMSTPQLVTLHGKKVESHEVITKDGYILTLHRIRNPFKNNDESYKLKNLTVLLHHGILGSSADWILLGPEKSLPYMLTNAGCDVWLTNARGNYYSRGHISTSSNLEYWNFSFQEMGYYDLPAVVDYIRKVKNTSEKINFIGHSLGATAFLVMLSTFPEYNKFFRIAIFLAPLAYMINAEGPIKVLTSIASRPPEQLLKLLGKGEFVPSRKIPHWIANKYCKGPELYCLNPLLFLSCSIPQDDTWDNGLNARVLYHVPAGGSTNTILHFAQMVKSGKFHKFNEENDEFELKHVIVPIVLFSSSDDCLATISDILRLYFSINNPVDHFVIRGKNFKHTDFVWSPEANDLVFEKVLEYLENGPSINASKINEI